METVRVGSIGEMIVYAEATARALVGGEAHGTVLALSGELGAGKTTFTQALAKALGVEDTVTSPTFVVMKRYPLPRGQFKTLVHIDLYRIEDESEIAPLRIREDLEDRDNLVVIEWPERVPSLIPSNAHHIHITTEADASRTITHTFHGNDT